MELILAVIVGFSVGSMGAWFVRGLIAKDRISTLTLAKEQMKESFEATATQALRANNELFLQTAEGKLDVALETAKRHFAERHQEFNELVKPLKENYVKLNPTIEALTGQYTELVSETSRLATALTSTRQAGAWGEIQLRRVVELAGMLEYCDFSEQVRLKGQGLTWSSTCRISAPL